MPTSIAKLLYEIRKVTRRPPKGREHLVFDERIHRWVLPADKRRSEARVRAKPVTPRGLSELGGVWSALDALDVSIALGEFDPQSAPSYANVNEHEVLEGYSTETYKDINEYLATGRATDIETSAYLGDGSYDEDLVEPDYIELKEIVREMQYLMVPMEEAQVLYRGTGRTLTPDGDEVAPGDLLYLDSFLSTSRSAQKAMEFMKGTLLEIHAQPDTRAITLDNQDTMHAEDETILNFAQCARVDQVEPMGEFGERQFIVLTMIPCPD